MPAFALHSQHPEDWPSLAVGPGAVESADQLSVPEKQTVVLVEQVEQEGEQLQPGEAWKQEHLLLQVQRGLQLLQGWIGPREEGDRIPSVTEFVLEWSSFEKPCYPQAPALSGLIALLLK